MPNYTSQLNLEKIDVLYDVNYNEQNYILIKDFPEILTYGKHTFKLSVNDPDRDIPNTEFDDFKHYLKDGSDLKIQLKDSAGNDLLVQITDVEATGVDVICSIWLKKDLKEKIYVNDDINSGQGFLTIVGELDNVTSEWENRANIRITKPVFINTKLQNTSPIVFKYPISLGISSSFSESIHLDKKSAFAESAATDTNYKRSYLTISASNLDTWGGKVEFGELSYKENRSRVDDYITIQKFQITGSPYEVSASNAYMLNPVSNTTKVLLPREIRRDAHSQFRLRFLNSKNEYALNLEDNTEFMITSSIFQISGSPLILEKEDTLVTGSAGITFGKSVNEGIKLQYNETEESLRFIHIKGAKEQKVLQELKGTKGGFSLGGDALSQKVEGTVSSSAILSGKDHELKNSTGSAILSGEGNAITGSYLSVIAGGEENTVFNSLASTIAGGTLNMITESNYGFIGGGYGNHVSNSDGSAVIGASNSKIASSVYGFIGSGLTNSISGSEYAMIIGGNTNIINGSRASSIGSGEVNYIHNDKNSFIAGGKDNVIDQGNEQNFGFNFIGAGDRNQIAFLCRRSSIVGGSANTISGSLNPLSTKHYSFIGGGAQNTIYEAGYATIAGGGFNKIMGGRTRNTAIEYDFIGGGLLNEITHGPQSGFPGNVIVGGHGNTIIASSSVMPSSIMTNSQSNHVGYNFIGSGLRNKIDAHGAPSLVLANGIVAGKYNQISGSADSCFIGAGKHNYISRSRSTTGNEVDDPSGSAIIAGNNNLLGGHRSGIFAGQNNIINHNNSFILGSGITSTADNTTYVENLNVSGQLTTLQLTSSIVSSSIIYSSGSNIFGDAISDTHTFNGHITASGDITASEHIGAGAYFVNGTAVLGSTATSLVFGNVNQGQVFYGNSHIFQSHITASQNISASGDITATGQLKVDGNVDFDGNLDVDGLTTLDDVNISENVDVDGYITIGDQ